MRLLPKKAVKEKVGFSFAEIDRKEARGDFPQRVRIGFRVFWSEDEIDDWIRERLGTRSA